MTPARPATILVIDDDTAVRSVLSRMLQSFGYAVLEAANHEETRSRLDENCETEKGIDLCVVDVRMPGTNLDALLFELRQRAPETRLMLTSGLAPEDLADLGLVVDRDEFLEKPFRMHELREQIARMLA